MNFKDDLATALKLAENAGKIALEVAKKSFEIRDKGDGLGPVTEGDIAVHDYLDTEMAKAFPGDLIVSEEAGIEGRNSKETRIWYIDPIDGTQEYIRGNDEWSVMIGLVQDQKPRLGIVVQPAAGITYFASEGQGCFMSSGGGEPKRIQVRPTQAMQDVVLVRSRSHPSKRIQRLMDEAGIKESYPHGSVGLKLAHIAAGRADMYVNFSTKCYLWDTCAGDAIIREAGGVCRSANGSEISYAPDKLLVDEVFFGATQGIATHVVEQFSKWKSKGVI